MHAVRTSRRGTPAPVIARRAMVSWTARLACGAALAAALIGVGWVQPTAAQDDNEIVLTAGGSTLVVSPGNADAISAVAEAHASPGHAHTKGAAAEAIADCEDGALTRGAAALAVAHPDEGALAQSAVTVIEAKNHKDKDKPIRKIVEKKCHEVKKETKKAPPAIIVPPAPEPVQELPVTGTGSFSMQPLASLLGAAAAAAALGAVGVAGARRVSVGAIVNHVR